MSEPEQPTSRRSPRSHRKRRSRSSRSGNPWPRVASGLVLVMLVTVAAGLAWARAGGLRGPRWLEQWPAVGTNFEPWQMLEPGIDYSRAHLASPRTLRCHALRIDLTNPELEFVVPRAVYAGGGETHAEWPMTWLKEHRLRAVLNATPFAPTPIFPGQSTRLQGLAVTDGERWSEPVGNLDNLVVSPNGVFRLLQGRMPTGEVRAGAGGFVIVRRAGVNVGDASVLDAATLVGLSPDRRWLYWLVVDGQQPGYSEGVTPKEASELMGGLGASDVIRMDGGASTALVVADSGSGGRVLNRPRNPIYDGAPRPVGNVLGIRRRGAP